MSLRFYLFRWTDLLGDGQVSSGHVTYCRAIRSGPFIAVSGTTSLKNGKVFAVGDPYRQTLQCLEIIEEALKELGLNRSHIIRTRMFVTDISKWESFGKAHGEFFKDDPPATSMLVSVER